MVGESGGVVTSSLDSAGSLSSRLCVFQFGHIEDEPSRRGVFPVTFVHFITD